MRGRVLGVLVVALAVACSKGSDATLSSGGGAQTADTPTSAPSTTGLGLGAEHDDQTELEGPTPEEEQSDTKDIQPENVEGALNDMEREVNAPY